MLVYAWNHPHEKNFIPVTAAEEKDLLNLFSKVLLTKLKALIKRGFYKEYVEAQSEVSMIRGKLLFKESIQSFSHKRGKMHVMEEEMSYDILHNQLIKTTLYYLAKQDQLQAEYQEEMKRILAYFEHISLIRVTARMFKEVNLHRNNQHYQFLLNICQFIWEHALLHEGKGEKQFQDVNREHQPMARLFENFVKNFYRTELKGSRAKSESFYWPAKGEGMEFLPKMVTDISLEYGGEKFIIDTKFYKNMFGVQWDKKSVRSAHLYQLFAYLKNDEYYTGQKANGILLYPKVKQTVNLEYQIHGFKINICTVDLNQQWEKIHERLLKIVQ